MDQEKNQIQKRLRGLTERLNNNLYPQSNVGGYEPEMNSIFRFCVMLILMATVLYFLYAFFSEVIPFLAGIASDGVIRSVGRFSMSDNPLLVMGVIVISLWGLGRVMRK